MEDDLLNIDSRNPNAITCFNAYGSPAPQPEPGEVVFEFEVSPGKELETFELLSAVARQADRMKITFESALAQAMDLFAARFTSSSPEPRPESPVSS